MGWHGTVDVKGELLWYFTSSGAAVGLRSASLEPSGGTSYDAHAAERQHERMVSTARRHDLARIARIEAGLRGRPVMAATLALVFTPFGAARADFRLATSLAWEGQSVVALAVDAEATERLWERRRPGITSDYASRLMLLAAEVSTLRRGNRIPHDHALAPVLRECCATAEVAAEMYARARIEGDRERARERREAAADAGRAAYVAMGGR